MRKALNILSLVAVVCCAWFAAGFAMSYLKIETVVVAVRFMFGAVGPIGGFAYQMYWKVHDATKAPGLSSSVEQRLQRVATLIMRRLWLMGLAAIAGAVIGAAASAFEPTSRWASIFAQSSLTVLGVLLVYVLYLGRLQGDLIQLERRVLAEKTRRDRKKDATTRLNIDKAITKAP